MDTHSPGDLKSFFAPRHIAVIGATPNNQWFGNIFANAMEAGFTGRLYPVNPKLDEIYGIRAYRSIGELPDGTIDFAVIVVKSDLVLDTMKELGRKGVRHVLVISSGFSEVGDAGRDNQRKLGAFCREHGIIMMGPNCLGFMNLAERTAAFSGRGVEGTLRAGPVGIVGQSGATSELIMTKMLAKTAGVSLFATTGNEARLQAEDCIEYFVNDEHTGIITGFIEQFRDAEKLKIVARRALEKKIPIIVLKVGRSARAVKAAQSHTGALAGNDSILDGFFAQTGIIRVDTVEELVDTAALFSRCDLPRGEGLGICTFSGGLCGLYADLCDAEGIHLPPLSAGTEARLRTLLPSFAMPDNPLDVTGSGFMGGMTDLIQAMRDDENIDIVVPVCIPPQGPDDPFAGIINNSFLPFINDGGKPIVPIVFKEMSPYAREFFREKGVYYIEHPAYGFRALGNFIRYASFLRKRGYTDNTRDVR